MTRLQSVRSETALVDVIRKALLEGDRIPRKKPAAAREVIAARMSIPGAMGKPTPPESDHANHALAVYWLIFFPFDDAE